jgi:hypothetical protein
VDRIDWARPILAAPSTKFKGGKLPDVAVDRTYAVRPEAMPVRFSQNLWVAGAEAGTWYFDAFGRAVAGLSTDGYDGRFTIENAP